MKARKWCRMDDQSDRYLSRNLKSWAAGPKPPANGRSRLLEAAATPQSSADKGPNFFSTFIDQFASQAANGPFSGWQFGPFTQTRDWSFYMTKTVFLVT